MIPKHPSADRKPEVRVAVRSRGGESGFRVRPAADVPDAVQAFAERKRSGVFATRLRDHAGIRAPVASRERDVGGEA